jgi:hypothetical protein
MTKYSSERRPLKRRDMYAYADSQIYVLGRR